MQDVGTFTYSLLTSTPAITSLVNSDNIFSIWPETITTFPCIIFDDEQRDVEFVDNKPTSSFSTVAIDIFVRDDTPTPIASAICDAFKNVYWSCEFNKLVPDPDTAVRHRSMRFTRPLYPDDI